MAKYDIEENCDELKNSHKTSKIDVPMTFEHQHFFFKFRLMSISIAITNTYNCMKFAKCDGRADGRTGARTNMINSLPEKKTQLIMLYSIGLVD